ncbi:MAG: permease [bacterium]|nr:permease [bacterium]
MDWKSEWKPLVVIVAVFLAFYFLPIDSEGVRNAVREALGLTQWYAREHVLLCLVPAFFIAGAIAVFISQQAVLRYLGPKANKFMAYGVASVSGSILAVCSCTVLPLFAGIYRRGAGIGPATAFLYSGPAINILAIILTARILGLQLGIARAVGAVVFSIVIGLLMHLIYGKEEEDKANKAMLLPDEEEVRPLWQTAAYFFTMVALLVSATWGNPGTEEGLYYQVFNIKWYLTALAAVALGLELIIWFKLAWWKLLLAGLITTGFALAFPDSPVIAFSVGIIGLSVSLQSSPGEPQDWLAQSWTLAKQIAPLLFFGVLVSGALLGQPPDGEGLIPSEWVSAAVGGNSFWSNFLASIVGAFMYFATLTEVPILQGLIGNGMGQGPALALLLAGPALSLPSMLVLASIMGWKKTTVYVSLVVIMATISGLIYGNFAR